MPAITDDTSDGEIVDIFVEEAAEVLENIDRHLSVWRHRPTDKNALAEIRRGFHTLKGSGRMVKALDLGELAWKVENMLNRAIDGTVPVTEPMVKLVAACRTVMPRMVDAFKGQRKTGMEEELESLMSQADAIASGQAAAPAPAPARPALAAGVVDESAFQLKLGDLQRRFERSGQRADEALHRSEMALQQVRRLAGQIGSLQSESQDRAGRAELNALGERLNAVTKELLELRLAAKKVQPEPAPHPRELLQLIDQRIKDKLTASERSRIELERKLDEARRAAAGARSVGIWALLISLLVLAGAAAGVFVATAT
jgi:chemotaxis protein histidine kinase CheA